MEQSSNKTLPVKVSMPETSPGKSTECEGKGNCGQCLKGGMPMKREFLSFLVLLLIGVTTALTVFFVQAKRELFKLESSASVAMVEGMGKAVASSTPYPKTKERSYAQTIPLPSPKLTGKMSVEQAIGSRRTRRTYTTEPITQAELAQMLWVGQGISDPASGKRTIPSARESYPMTLFIVIRNVDGVEPGLYEYLPKTHALGKMGQVNLEEATKNSGIQDAAQKAPAVIFVSAAIGNYQEKTKSTTTTATFLEAGHIGQNLYLQAESLGLGMVVMAGFDSSKVTSAFGIDTAETIEYVAPFGNPAPEPVEE